MNRRYLVFGLASVLALSLVVPALGGPSSPVATVSASAKKIANRALRAANAAQDTANKAQTAANTAQTTANQARTAATAADAKAVAANDNANTRIKDTDTIDGPATANDADNQKNASAVCPPNSFVTGGGYSIGGTDNEDEAVVLEATYGDSWLVGATEIDGSTPGNWSLQARAICGLTGP